MSEDLVERPVSPTIRLTVWLLIGVFVAIVVGSYAARTEIVARGQGKALPAHRVQVVQPQVDGKIAAIMVEEGEPVRRGEPLVIMDGTSAESDVRRIMAEIDRELQESAVARSILEPLASGDPTGEDFVDAGTHALRHSTSASGEHAARTEALVVSVLSALRDRIAEIDARLLRIRRAESAQLARIERVRSDKEIVSKRFASADILRQRGTISEVDYLDRLRGLKAAENDTVIAERELNELAAEAEAVAKERVRAISDVRSTYQKQFNTAEITMQSLRAELAAADSRIENLTLEAPVEGRVENLSVYTLGGFVEAGATLMSIVPTDGKIEIEAFFDNQDVGFLQHGQRAFIKFDAFPAERFGIVRGRVVSVGADARQQAGSGKWVYAVRLRLDQNSIGVGDRMIGFAPGMTATIDVITGERRLISYFFEPVLKALQNSFGER
ncbi:UNVERIFIED_ORG: hemolysin D [Ensifer adhaerens]|nr:hemolysin D [Ensifer adhaerens]